MSILLIGAKRSGLSVLASIMNCSRNCNLSFGTVDDVILSLNGIHIHVVSLTPEVYKLFGLSLLDRLHDMRQNSSVDKIIWLTRNPVVSISSFVVKDNMSIDTAVRYWIDVNTILWYFFQAWESGTSFGLQYENILLKEQSFKESFRFLGMEFNKQYLRYGDFDQPYFPGESIKQGIVNPELLDSYNPSSIVGLRTAWEIWRKKPIVSKLGYNRIMDL